VRSAAARYRASNDEVVAMTTWESLEPVIDKVTQAATGALGLISSSMGEIPAHVVRTG
jgi:hypothetical protein